MELQLYDVIIVGGGHNGLVAANYLGRAGKKVLVLERRDIVGGRFGADAGRQCFDGQRRPVCSRTC